MIMPSKIEEILNKNLYCPAWYSIIINPYFIIRRGLLKAVIDFSKSDFSEQKILDVGCGIKPYEKLFLHTSSYTGIDIQGGGHRDNKKTPDKFYDGINVPFNDNFFDSVIATEVLEHILEPQQLLSEMTRVLKPGGTIFITMPFVWAEHEVPYDFQRFTRYKLEQMFRTVGLSEVIVSETTGIFRVCGQLLSAFIFERLFPNNKLLKSIVAVFICFPIQILFIICDTIFKNSWLTLNYSVSAKKLF